MNAKDAILQMPRRADKWDEEVLVKTFVNIGPLIPTLLGVNNQILFGRRGTGKTHVLRFLKSIIEKEKNDCCIFIDIRQIGSTGSIYSDQSIPSHQRAARLFTDILQEVRNQIIRFVTKNEENKEKYLSTVTPVIDELVSQLNLKEIFGSVKQEQQVQSKTVDIDVSEFTISRSPSYMVSSTQGNSDMRYESTIKEGESIDYLDFSKVFQILKRTIAEMYPRKLWILIDEFAELSTDLQVLLSDMFRRVLCPLENCIFKIAAIEHRSEFKRQIDSRNYLGLELGADVYSCNLDDFMVFSNNQAQALIFFRDLIYQHINSMLGDDEKYDDSNSLINDIFTQEKVFEELVQAAEGVPRDAFNVLAKAVSNDYYNKVSINSIRRAAKNWYNEDKQNPIISYSGAMSLLNWIIENVINERHARAFLLRNDREYEMINFLYDSRILHIIKQNISSRDNPGMKFNAYSIDYGCYVDLINTKRFPLGLFQEELENGEIEYCQVPQEDYRSIRRAILDMDIFLSSRQ